MKILEMKKGRECDRDEGSGRERKKKKKEREERKSQKEEREFFFFFLLAFSLISFQRWNDTIYACQKL